MTNLGGADPRLLERLREMQQRFEGVNESLADPDVNQNVDRLRVLGQERAELEPVVHAADELLRLVEEHEGASELLREASDQELRDMAGEEVASLEARIESLGAEACLLLIPKDPLDDRAAVVEIRAGTGGDEAGLFANDLFRMYRRVAEREGWTVELMNRSEGIPGSLKEAIFTVRGKGVYGRLRYESGVHRVQRVPETESQGRIHTSAATVAVLPEADEVDLAIDAKDLRYDVFRSSGPGGQSVNTTDSAVRITHIPTGLVVSCQDEKSQLKNKAKALKVLRSRLLDQRVAEQEAERSRQRRAQVGTGDRSAKIRTYNFPQSRVTDHRIKLTVHTLDQVLDGDLNEVLEALRLADQEERIRGEEE
ncbi:MAG: peptide chain release factor 1 [Gemmatimonadota bacterium]|nr:peptide chain release factor 1 [Gemmatimonadota bacterium]|tara:strand:- start:6566 stop:7666 length:1101 start_codon:yes stop_codon:yes gene_type:complete